MTTSSRTGLPLSPPRGATLARTCSRRWRSSEARRGRHLSAAVQPALRVGIFGAARSSRSRPANPAPVTCYRRRGVQSWRGGGGGDEAGGGRKDWLPDLLRVRLQSSGRRMPARRRGLALSCHASCPPWVSLQHGGLFPPRGLDNYLSPPHWAGACA